MKRLVACGILAAALVAAPPAVRIAAQNPPPAGQPQPQIPTFRSRIDSVSVDVAVTDKQGRPITDLTQEDFELRESKQIQKIENFKLIEVDELAPPPPPILSLAAQVVEAAREDTRLVVVFLDDYHTRQINSLRIRGQIAGFLSRLGPTDLVTVAGPLIRPDALTFSYNHDAVAEVVNAFDGRKYDYRPRNQLEAQYDRMPVEEIERMRNETVIASLYHLCEYLGTIRQGRKTLLYVGEGMLSQLPPGVNTIGGISNGMAMTETQAAFATGQLISDLSRVFQAASRSNTSVYTLDPRGLSTSEYGAGDRVDPAKDRQLFGESTDLLRSLADQTDGRAIIRNDPVTGLRQMIRDTGTYYLLGYTTAAPHDGRFHEIQVRVKRPNVEVRARKGFWAYTEDAVAKVTAPPKPSAPRDVGDALAALEASADAGTRRPVRVTIGAQRLSAERALVTLAWETTSETPPSNPADLVDHVSIAATSLMGTELFKGPVPKDAQATRPSGSITFESPAGTIGVRSTAENARGARLDTEDLNFEIPKLTTSGVVILPPLVYRGRTARDIQELRAAAAPLPAASRVFARAERLLVRFDVIAASGVTPTVTMKLLNQQGSSMAELPAPTAVAGAEGRFESVIGLASLPGGTYLVEIAAEAGGTKTRTLLAIRISG